MPDAMTPEQRSRAMAKVKTKDGPLEVAVRSALHRKGYRFRKHVKGIPGSPDVVFTKKKVAIFIDGDFWHGYNFEATKDKLKPFWRDKIETNMARDQKNFALLREMGWGVVRLWGHEVKKDLEGCLLRVEDALQLSERSGGNGKI
jgi:DNA mismatch endonuclease (patch repair protein)